MIIPPTPPTLLRDRLKTEPWLPGVLSNWVNAPYMQDEDILNELKRSIESLIRIKAIKGCGQITSQELKFLNKYRSEART